MNQRLMEKYFDEYISVLTNLIDSPIPLLDNFCSFSIQHIVAPKGNDKCVLVLKSHADPNIKDFGGNVPVWEAMLERYQKSYQTIIRPWRKLIQQYCGLLFVHNSRTKQCGTVEGDRSS